MRLYTNLNCLFSFLILCCLVSCKKDNPTPTYSTEYRAFIALNPTSCAELLTATSQGSFVTIRSRVVDGNTKIQIYNGQTTGDYPMAAIDYRSFYFGLGGFIVGTNYQNEGLAYDLACPNCNRAEYRLTMRTDGTCVCGHCNIVYDLNNYGVINNTEKNTIHSNPRGLLRYRAEVNPSVVHVYN